MEIAKFMASPLGRIGRVALGIVMIVIAISWDNSPWSYVLELLALIPILAGLLNVCVLAPFLKVPAKGKDLPR